MLFDWLNQTFPLFGLQVKWSDFLGNLLALATVWLALRRLVIAWPVQILGSVLLFAASISADLGGNAARQVLIIVAAAWGWSRWRRSRQEEGTVVVRWGTWKERACLLVAMLAGTAAMGWLLRVTDASFYPGAPLHLVLADAWIFVGTVLAMYAQARRIIEFWFVWIAVDIVGVSLAWSSGLYFSGIVYAIFFVLVIVGIRNWSRNTEQRISSPLEAATDIDPAPITGPDRP